MIILSIANLTKTYPSMSVLDKVNLALRKGEKVGLVGPNGIGKTTLLEIILGHTPFDSGSVDKVKKLKMAYLPQMPDMSEAATLYDYLKGGIADLLSLRSEVSEYESKIADGTASKGDLDRYSLAIESYRHLGGYTAENQIEKMAAGLGLSTDMFEMPLAKLSGGQKNRAALVRLLISEPELMLLDEPTNHLDIEGIEFLENYLHESPSAAIIVSHDRRFLDKVVSRVWEIRGAKIKSFPGNFSAYLERKEKDDELAHKAFIRQRQFIARTEGFIRKYIAGQKTKQARSRRKMLTKLERLEKPLSEQRSIGLTFSDAARSDRIVCLFDQVDFGYGDKQILDGVSLTIERGNRVGLLGKNGVGKTTILELANGALKPQAGQLLFGKNIKLGYFRQIRNEFSIHDTPIDVIRRAIPQYNEGKMRDFLAGFLFTGDDVFRPMSTFSGGQKSRLSLALLMAAKPNFLVLDEPTNHLDIPSLEALENAIEEFKGTLLVVSHDRYFLDSIVDRILVLEDCEIESHPGNYSYYEAKRLQANIEEIEPPKPKQKKLPAKQKPRRTNPLIIQKVKDDIRNLESLLHQIGNDLENSQYASDWQKLNELQAQRTAIEERVLQLYEQIEKLKQQPE